jgi:hypothetical protein
LNPFKRNASDTIPAVAGTMPRITDITDEFRRGPCAAVEEWGGGSDADGNPTAPPPLPNDARDEMLKSSGSEMPKEAAAAFMSKGDIADRSKPEGRGKPAAAAAWAMEFGDGDMVRVPPFMLLLLLLPLLPLLPL